MGGGGGGGWEGVITKLLEVAKSKISIWPLPGVLWQLYQFIYFKANIKFA